MNASSKSNSKELDLTPDEANELAQQFKEKEGACKNIQEEKIYLLINGLGDKRGLIRRTYAEQLGKIGLDALPGLLDVLLNSENVIARRAAAKTIKLVGEPSALPSLLKALMNDKDPVVQGSSAGAMAIFGEEAVKYLLKVLTSPTSSAMQCGLATWAITFAGINAANSVKEAAQSDHPAIRTAGISALGEIIQTLNDKHAEDLLFKALDDPINEVRIEATRLISNINQPNKVEKLLIKKLNDNNLLVRKNAAISLMKLNSKNSIFPLKERISLEIEESMINILNLAISKINNNT